MKLRYSTAHFLRVAVKQQEDSNIFEMLVSSSLISAIYNKVFVSFEELYIKTHLMELKQYQIKN